jgi:phosphatidylglycerophosphatase A
MKLLHYFIATGFGTGYIPLAPGTAGSLLTVFVIYFLSPISSWILIVSLLILFCLGIYSSHYVERLKGIDPSIVTIDEIVGMGISLLFIPKNWLLFLIAFLFFRLFDIAKPPPINKSQEIGGGLGIMLDDIIAGVYAFICLFIIRWLFF